MQKYATVKETKSQKMKSKDDFSCGTSPASTFHAKTNGPLSSGCDNVI